MPIVKQIYWFWTNIMVLNLLYLAMAEPFHTDQLVPSAFLKIENSKRNQHNTVTVTKVGFQL